MARLRLNSGDTLRRDHVKLTPVGLAKIFVAADGIVSPFESLNLLPSDLKDPHCVKAARQSWRSSTGWKEVLGLLGNTATIAQAILQPCCGFSTPLKSSLVFFNEIINANELTYPFLPYLQTRIILKA